MRICFISDIHANLFALYVVLHKAKQLKVDKYICLGDIVGYGPHPQECIEVLSNLENIEFVKGNHDHAVGSGELEFGCSRIAGLSTQWTISNLEDHHRKWLVNLPLEHTYTNWMVVHGAPRDPKRMYGYVYEMTYEDNLKVAYENNYHIVFYGHTHIPFIHTRNPQGQCFKNSPVDIEIQEGITYLINPGSVGQPRDGEPCASFGVWDQEKKTFQFYRVEYDIKKTMAAILSQGLPEDLARRLEIGR